MRILRRQGQQDPDLTQGLISLAGLDQNAGAAGKSREAAAMSAGFCAIALMGLWRTWRLWRDPAAGEKPKK